MQVAAAAALWGTWSIFLRWSGLPGLTASAILMTVLALSGLPWQWAGRARQRPTGIWAWMWLFGLLDAGNSGFFFLAIANGSVAVATLTHYLAPILTPAMALLFLRERPSRRTFPAALLGLFGLTLLLWPSAAQRGPNNPLVLTALLGSASAVFYSTMVPLGKKLSPFFSPMEVQSFHSYLSAALLWALAAHLGPPSLAATGRLLVGTCFCGVLAGGLLYAGIRHIPSSLASVLTYLEPLVATAVGVAVFREAVGPLGYLGAALVLGGGVYLVSENRPAPGEGLRAAVRAA